MSRKSSSSKSSNANDANEKNSAAIREFQVGIAENKKCFECDQRGPTYVDMTIGSFVCTKCSGMLRGITPPHRIKSISMSSFSTDEVTFLKSRGNVWCSKVWMGLYDKNRSAALDSKDEDALKYHIIQKYEKKSYYVDPSQIQQTLSSIQSSSNVPLTSSSSSASTGGFIGTTLTQRVNNFSNNRPSASAALPSSTTIQASSAIPPSIPISKPVTTKPNGSIPSSMSGIVLPPPVVDPFFSNANFPAASTSSSASSSTAVPFATPSSAAFGDMSFTSSPSASVNASKISQQAPQQASANSNSSKTANESFANFDAAHFDSVAAKSAKPITAIKIPPPPGFIPPPVISVLNPTPAVTKAAPNYKIDTQFVSNNSVSVNKSILRVPKQSTIHKPRVVSFDLSCTNSLAAKKSNPSMPNLSQFLHESSNRKNPFLDDFEEDSEEEIEEQPAAVKLGENFFASLFVSSNNANKPPFPDPWASSTSSSVVSNQSFTTPKSNAAPPPVAASVFSASPLKPAGSVMNKSVSPSVITSTADKAGQGGGEDKYSALKELDEIFKSTVVMSDGKSTGTSLFGSSPLQASQSPILTNAGYGPSPTNNAAGPNGFDTGAFWNDSKPAENRSAAAGQGYSSPNWVPNWGNAGSSTSSSSQAKAPINPFTGASNLTQLNTSPWPTTGTSPVANASSTASSSNSTPWPPSMNVGAMGSTSSAGFGFGSQASPFNASQPSNDPFGAAPASNIQKTENNINNNDLFAKAPFGSEQVHGGSGIDNSTINALTQDIFGNAPSSPSQNMNMASSAQQQDFNPWASPSASSAGVAQQTSIFSSASKPKSTNPFL